jgi:hypothetical protein
MKTKCMEIERRLETKPRSMKKSIQAMAVSMITVAQPECPIARIPH